MSPARRRDRVRRSKNKIGGGLFPLDLAASAAERGLGGADFVLAGGARAGALASPTEHDRMSRSDTL